MAAGRSVRYPDHELRDKESNSRFSRRESGYSNENYDHVRNTALDNDNGRVSNLRHGDSGKDRDRIRSGARHRDIQERDMVNSGFRSLKSNPGSREVFVDRGPKRCGFSARSVDREPGELSSESGSDDLIESDSLVKDNGVVKQVENGGQSPVEKKRKFSPIVWDRDDHERRSLSRNEKSVEITPLPPPPPLVKRSSKSPSVNGDGNSHLSSTESNMHQDPAQVGILAGSVPTFSSPVGISSLCVVEQSSNAVQDAKQVDAPHLENEENMPTRHISSSRWAAGNSSPTDEGEIVEEVGINKRRKKPLPVEFLQGRSRDKSLTPEAGEFVREGYRSSDSDERRYHALPLSRDDFEEKDAVKGDNMEIDEVERRRGNTSDSLSETDSDEEFVRHETPEPAGPLRSINMLQGCRSVDEFERLNKIDEGTYGVVYRAKDKKTGEIVALKKVKMEKEREGFPLTALREINILLSFHHPSIVDVKEVVVGSSLDSIFMVMEYMEHDLKALMESMKQRFSQSEVKCLMLQLLEGVKYLHDNWVLHRDLKTSNLLLNNRGELKICDFGLARQYGSPLKPYTHLVVTLWYRAPELLLGAKQYSTAIDMWSLGCIMAELLSKAPLFNGKTEFDQLDKIFRILGTPNESIWPGFSKLPGVKVNFVKHQYNLLRKKFPASSFTGSPVLSDAGFDLLNKLLTYDPERRITADAALKHDWFREVPLPKSKDFMPTFPAQHAHDRRGRRLVKSPDPLEEQRRKELTQTELGSGGLFG